MDFQHPRGSRAYQSLFPADSLSNNFIEQVFRTAGLERPRKVVTSFSIQMRLHLLNRGDFLTVLHWSSSQVQRQAVGLKILPVRLPCDDIPHFHDGRPEAKPGSRHGIFELRSAASNLHVPRASVAHEPPNGPEAN
jgi:hypothetical protein